MESPWSGGVADEIQQLHELNQKGVLTDDEFAAAKAAVIGAGPQSPASTPAPVAAAAPPAVEPTPAPAPAAPKKKPGSLKQQTIFGARPPNPPEDYKVPLKGNRRAPRPHTPALHPISQQPRV